MEAGDSALPVSPAAEPAPAPPRRWKGKLLLLLLLLPFFLLVLGVGLFLLPGKPAAPQTGLLTIKPAGFAGSFVSPTRLQTLTVENRSASTLLLWQPCRIERKETGRIIVAGSSTRTLVLMGTNTTAGPRQQFVMVQLSGTNRGPWRLLVPVGRYEWVARLEKLLGKRIGSLDSQLRVLDSLLQRSRAWVASEWFDEPSSELDRPWGPTVPGLSNRPPGAFSRAPVPAPRVPPGLAMQLHHDDTQTFFFIVRNFSLRYRRWPQNMAEVKKFAADPANLQPEFPAAFEREAYADAVFSTNSDGGLHIEYRNGRMTLGGPPK
jgi:hypothetical protein